MMLCPKCDKMLALKAEELTENSTISELVVCYECRLAWRLFPYFEGTWLEHRVEEVEFPE